jgi:hypothetical protein
MATLPTFPEREPFLNRDGTVNKRWIEYLRTLDAIVRELQGA